MVSNVFKAEDMYTRKYGMIDTSHVIILESYLEKAKNKVIVELGFGRSEEINKKARYTYKYLAIEKDKIIRHPSFLGNALIIHADAKALPLIDEKVDLVLALGLFGSLDIDIDGKSDLVKEQTLEITEFGWTYIKKSGKELLAELMETWSDRSKKVIDEAYRILAP